MKIYTKRGDQGETGLFGGERVGKHHARVVAYGTVDEAASAIGLAAATPGISPDIRSWLYEVLSDLLDAGSELATPSSNQNARSVLAERLVSRITDARIGELEQGIDAAEQQLPRLETFILPTGSEASARLHVARASVRRSERKISDLASQGEEVRPDLQRYINRLSDYLFMLARLENHRCGFGDIPWDPKKSRT